MKTVAYYRVSTDRQGRSGLGLEAQQAAVKAYLDGRGWPPVAEFVEVESGRKADRPQLRLALEACRVHKAKLIIAKLDRLSRDAVFLLSLRDSGVDFVAADMPDANRLTVGILAMVAEDEADRISQRTKAALAAAKARGTRLGGYRGYTPTEADRERAAVARRAQAKADAEAYRGTVERLRGEGIVSMSGMAKALNEQDIPSPRGGRWQAVSVRRLITNLGGM